MLLSGAPVYRWEVRALVLSLRTTESDSDETAEETAEETGTTGESESTFISMDTPGVSCGTECDPWTQDCPERCLPEVA